MKKSVSRAMKAALLVLFCAIGIYGIFFSARNLTCAIDGTFSWKAYSYTPVTNGTIYNYAFPSEEISVTAENQNTIAQLILNSKGKRRFPGSWTPYGVNTRIPCIIMLEIENVETTYTIFLCKDSSTEFLLLKSEVQDKTQWYDLKNPELAQYLNTLYPYDTTGNTVTHTVGTNN